MRGRRKERIEGVIDHGAALLLAIAVGFASFLLLPRWLAGPERNTVAAAAAAAAYWLTACGLRGIAAQTPTFDLPHFELPVLETETAEELLLTDADRLKHTIVQMTDVLDLTDADRLPTPVDELVLTDADRLHTSADELVLDDILAELGPNSRVVRLFDPSAMPTPGQLNARIEQHLHGTPSPAAHTDASQALYEALSELRRSLR
jgi:hypothetical protein